MDSSKRLDSFSAITEKLNEDQLQAVTAERGNQLVLAGAGSGKTRVLVHRMAYLVEHFGCKPWEVMAVTFTNKASKEMAGRIANLLGLDTSRLWIGTFHSLSSRLLRRHAEAAQLPRQFEILDTAGQSQVLRRVVNQLGSKVSSRDLEIGQVISWISRRKDEGLRAQDVWNWANSPNSSQNVLVYQAYEAHCQRFGLVDFGEMLLRTYEMLNSEKALLSRYQDQFREILVDEFQDTNAIQYALIKLLAGDSGHVMAVGDDDQSIYGWRGAEIENIRNFEADFPNTQVVRLEQNYRSTGNILNVANTLINQNDDRLGKKLWTKADEGKRVRIFEADNETDEALYVVRELERWLDEDSDRTYNDVAVLYRQHFQSQVLERQLRQRDIPYVIRGYLRFFERKEIKDAVAHMQLIARQSSDIAFDRVLNLRARGIGTQSQNTIREIANRASCSLWEGADRVVADGLLKPAQTQNLKRFLDEISSLVRKCEGRSLEEIADICVNDSGVMDVNVNNEREPDVAESRRQNLLELMVACASFEKDLHERQTIDSDHSILQRFLDSASLDTGETTEEDEFQVSLMTLHAAKGLEFPLVFAVGWEQGLFPSFRSLVGSKLEEERRLAYVGITRAMERLHISLARSRSRWGGSAERTTASQFIFDLPKARLQIVRGGLETPRSKRTKATKNRASVASDYQDEVPKAVRSRREFHEGDRVSHARFGSGEVVDVSGFGSNERVSIAFKDGKRRTILASMNFLTKEN